MKRLWVSVVGWAILGMIAPASAADMAVKAAPPPAPLPMIYNWSGFYIGANGGWADSHNCWDFITTAGVTVAGGCNDRSGGVIGGQVGYRWQANQFVFGLEAQGDWADLSGRNASAVFGVANRTRVDAFGLFTGQVGYAWNNALLYVKGGAAVTRDRYRGIGTGGLAGAEFDGADETRWGGTVGVGLEYGFAPNWSVGVEYDHLFMGRRDVTLSANGALAPVGTFSRTERIGQDVDLITARINYRFGGPVIAKY